MSNPLVSVICLCYNHEKYVRSSLQSVIDQTYESVEIIIVNDASTDQSRYEILQFLQDHPYILFIDLQENVGNCRAFNQGLRKARGEYVIDLATDDQLTPDRITRQVAAFQQLDSDYGVVFSDARYLDEQDQELGTHFSKYPPERGDLYTSLIARYFIPPTTMMIKKVVFDELGGYDEHLTYEDFDFWVRSSRKWKYDFIEHPLTLIRKSGSSLSSGFYLKNSKLIPSTFQVCRKIREMNQNRDDEQALIKRLQYELKIAAVTGNRKIAGAFFRELKSLHASNTYSYLYFLFSKLNWHVYGLISRIQQLR